MKAREILERGLIGLMRDLGISKVRTMGYLALIRTYQLHEMIADWVASFHDSEDTITLQTFTAKLNELIEEKEKEK
jgi:hypothetical protein